ncbi:hypothetical protein K1719_023876 [Acacia pycnantha]|nr:hypothetical protein K1719_023876 [Acacia pycnantha]
MNHMRMNSQTPILPEEITRNILERLPVKSLIRFQCVCKHWKNLIKSRSFVADHLHHSTHQNLSLLLEEDNLRLCLLDCELQHRKVQSALPIKSFQGARIVGSCNGLLCVQMDQDDKFPPSLLLWNPANRAYRYVPRRTYADSDDCVVGFGFSPVVDDYKIVRAYSESDDVVNRVEVFSLNRGSWKGIDIGNLKGVKLCHESVATNRAIFWSGLKLGAKEEGEDDTEEDDDDDMEEAEDETEVIVSFDIAREIFTLMPRPDLDSDAIEKLTVYENKLAMLCYIWDEDDERYDMIDLWVMEKGTVERWNWIKIYSSNPCSYTLEPMTIWRNHVVCKASSEEDKVKGRDALYLLNLTTNEAKTFDITKCCYYVHSMCNYVESLVSLTPARGFSIMNHMGMNSQTPILPEEITRNILERLPVKSLIRFQCVCKHWKNLIKSRSFVANHLHHSTHQNLSLLLEEDNLCLCLLDCELQDRKVQSALPIKSFQGARIVGSCNGLLFVEMDRDDKFPPSLLLWNPANRAYRYVPRRTYAFSDDCVVGFGFSSVVNDYKIVRAYSESDDVVNRVEVFSLNRGSWKGIDIGNLMGVKLCHESVATYGAIFWSGLKLGAKEEGEDDTEEEDVDTEDDDDDMEEAEDETEVIVSFDIAREIFILMPRPDLDYNAIEKLTVYENKLAMLCYIWDEDDERFDMIDLWVMEKGTEERWNWIKIYSSNPCSYTLEPMTIWRNHVVCKASSEEDKVKGRDALYLLNLTTNEAKTFDIPKCCYYVRSMCNYVESLVSLGTYR